jgi:hypothetical protein
MAKRITEFTSATSLAETDVLPIVDVSDTTQATSGTTKKSALSLIADYLKARVETLTNKTLTSPKINEDVVLTATSTELNKITGMLDWFYPVGTIYETTSTDLDTTTKMGNHFGGTWEVYGAGRVLVAKSDDTEFDTIGKTGGSKTHTLTAAEIPKIDVYGAKSGTGGTTVYRSYTSGGISDTFSGVIGQVQGGEQPHNNLQPYIVVYRYRRTA